MRTTTITRKTKETDIKLTINLDGQGMSKISSGIGFLDHMLELFSKHSLIDFQLDARGDLGVDGHHSVEDIGIVLGTAIAQAVGDKKGVGRYGTMILPMDEVLVLVSLDLAGRFSLGFDASFSREKVGDLPTELVYDFFDAVAQNAKLNLQIKLLVPGRNDHHRIEAIFKAFGRALRQAVETDERANGTIPSTKGTLTK